MIDVSEDIHSLTEFKSRTTEFLKHLRAGDRTLLLTVNGRAELAVMSAATFQRVREALEALDAITGIKDGLEDVQAGRTRPAAVAFAEIRKGILPQPRE